MASRPDRPLIYSCSGCSSAAQMANKIAVTLDRSEQMEMSCIAGVGGDVKPLVRLAKTKRVIVAVDGCALQCVKACLGRHGVTANHHFVLGEYGVEKKMHADFSEEKAKDLMQMIVKTVKGENLLEESAPSV